MGCCNSAVVGAPLEKVWSTLRDFHDLSWAPNVITKLEKIGSAHGTQIGAKRVLNDAFHETLVALDDEAHTIRSTTGQTLSRPTTSADILVRFRYFQ